MKAKKILSTLLAALLLAVLTAGAALASEGNEIEVVGTIVGIYPDEFRFEIEVDNDGVLEILNVQVGQNFNFDSLVLGDTIELKGTLNEDGTLVLTELKIRDRIRDRIKTQEGELVSYYCTAEDQVHPVAMKAADTYGVAYEDLLSYLCGESPVPLGQILLALQTAALTGGDYTEYLDGFEEIHWGQIWQDLGLQGKPDHGTAPGQIKQQDGEGDPAGNGDQGQGQKNGQGFDVEEFLSGLLPQGWFQKGRK